MLTIQDHLIPVAPGNAVDAGWTPATGYKPRGVTWHWTATATLVEARAMLGGSNPTRKGQASAHYCVGRSEAEGIDRWVSLENRSWHAGALQTLRWDGRTFGGPDDKGSRTCVGIETVNLGYARSGVPAGSDWVHAATPQAVEYQIQPWTEEQLGMCIALGRLVIARWPNITARDHCGHHDLCPQYKEDVSGFPFARVLRGIYNDNTIPDVWTSTWTIKARQSTLIALGYDLGRSGADGLWGPRSQAALKKFQQTAGLPANGCWTTSVSWKAYDAAQARRLSWPLATVT